MRDAGYLPEKCNLALWWTLFVRRCSPCRLITGISLVPLGNGAGNLPSGSKSAIIWDWPVDTRGVPGLVSVATSSSFCEFTEKAVSGGMLVERRGGW